MLADPRFARVTYTLFGVAILATLLKEEWHLGCSDPHPACGSVGTPPKAEEAMAAGEKVSGGERGSSSDVGPPEDTSRLVSSTGTW